MEGAQLARLLFIFDGMTRMQYLIRCRVSEEI